MIYFLAHNGFNVFHYGQILDGEIVSTGQPYLEYFNDEASLSNRLDSFPSFGPTLYSVIDEVNVNPNITPSISVMESSIFLESIPSDEPIIDEDIDS